MFTSPKASVNITKAMSSVGWRAGAARPRRPHQPLLTVWLNGFISIATVLSFGCLEVTNRSMKVLEESAKVIFLYFQGNKGIF